ncbi:MAG: hypothetical protein ACKOCM_02125 [Cyanobacteriota bacterium]
MPVAYVAIGQVVTTGGAFRLLFGCFWRTLGAGVLASLAVGLGWLSCLLPGLVIALVYPVFANKIFATDQPVFDAFGSAFRALHGSPEKWPFVGIPPMARFLVLVVTLDHQAGWIALPVEGEQA